MAGCEQTFHECGKTEHCTFPEVRKQITMSIEIEILGKQIKEKDFTKYLCSLTGNKMI